MGIAFGTAVSVFRNVRMGRYRGTYNYVKLADIVNDKPCMFPICRNRYAQIGTDTFKKIPECPIAYWVSDSFIKAYDNKQLADCGDARSGLQTGNNELYLRLWFEVSYKNIAFGLHTKPQYLSSNKKWIPQVKGGSYRQWYGNLDYTVNWENDGYAIRHEKGCRLNAMANDELFFREGVTWSHTTSGGFGARYLPKGLLFNVEAPTFFPSMIDLYYTLAFLNSKVAKHYLGAINSTIHFLVGNIIKLPIIVAQNQSIGSMAARNIEIAKDDWDSFETSWDFKKHPLI